MKKTTLNLIVNIACLVTFIPSLFSGLVLYFYLPSGSGRGGLVTYLGLTRSQWLGFHDYTSFAFTGFLIIHLALHWKFFRIGKKNLTEGTEEPIRV
jgi:hypothetical protein